MTDREDFIAAILGNPDDDAIRLIYADWLEEHGTEAEQARARFIRLQIEIEQCSDGDKRRTENTTECERLLELHWRQWLRGFDSDLSYCPYYYKDGFKRGFMSYVCLDAENLSDPTFDDFLKHEPISEFLMRRIDTFPDTIAQWPHLSRIRSLCFSGGGDNLKAVLRSPLLTRLENLNAFQALNDEDLEMIATDDRFARLKSLDISFGNITDQGIERLAYSTVLTQLTELDYGSNETTIAALEALARSPLSARLTSIGLRRGVRSSTGGIGLRGVELLRNFSSLVSLDLQGQNLGDDGISALSQFESLRGLKKLDLDHNQLGLSGMQALLGSPYLTSLEELDLSNNPPGNAWLGQLSSTGRRRFKSLILEDNELDSTSATNLANSDVLEGVQELSLLGNPIGNAGAIALANTRHVANVRKLVLGQCSIGDEGVIALAESLTLPKLTGFGDLGLSGNIYSDHLTARLEERFGYDPESY